MRAFHSLSALLFAVCCSIGSTAYAAVIYDEAVQGDLPDDLINGVIVNTQEGDNRVKGKVGIPPDDADAFRFIVLPELKVTDIVVSIPPIPDEDIMISWTVINRTQAEITEESRFELPDGFFGSLKDQTPVEGPPLGDLSDGIHGMRFKVAEDPDYEVNIIVTPEPGTLAVVLPAGAAFLRLRPRHV